MTTDRLPSLQALPQQYPTFSSSSISSPRVSSFGSAAGSQSSFTSAASSNGPKTPSPTLPVTTAIPASAGPSFGGYDHYSTMNQPPPEMYYQQQQHMSAGQPPPQQQPVTSASMSHYSQPPPLQPSHIAQYPAPAQQSYGQHYGYPNGLTSPQSAPPAVSNPMSAQNVLPLPQGAAPSNAYAAGQDTTGQVAPPGMKPRVTATLWEDEGSLCFQVEARGICVARREDNHMINGTKLLNVAGMTRGRRDGILKSEKVRHVVKIGPMHLKGVWIPFERALDFANKEKIVEMLYPLFVHNIGALLYHPTNQNRTSQVMASQERRNREQGQMRTPSQSGPGLAPIQQQHHHHQMGLPGPQQALPSHSSMARPGIDRAHTFPTPPASATSVIGNNGLGAPDGYSWGSQGMSGGQGQSSMSIDTGLSNARSMPATPATTPPGNAIQGMQQYQSSAPYDSARPMYNSAPSNQHSPYQTTQSSQDRMYGHHDAYGKNDMGPPTSRNGSTAGPPPDQKPANGILHHGDQNGASVAHSAAEEEQDNEHDGGEYTHDNSGYENRAAYPYVAPPVGALSAEHQHIAPEMTGSPNHTAASGRATPRTTAAQPYYPQQASYNTSPRAQHQSSSNLYNVMSNDRGPTNGATADVYAPSADMNGYPSQQSMLNGSTTGIKRSRDDDDDLQRPMSGDSGMELKRRKTLIDATVPGTYESMGRPGSNAVAPGRRR
ncbi:cell pattern formation-associated protein stuA [Plectosphaerella plurivora]|uniref:Cell pattern formation-associated protein stuA n=1 Tax=Plectosphaerella plurivora TaxID=936078 RepID=A0A9P9AIQ0_9PEZI|nr:cell pattern formation-associated protein stuA [Plectosphaerella plurivora]